MRHHHQITHASRACDLYIEGFTEEHRLALFELFTEIAPIIPPTCSWLKVSELPRENKEDVASISPAPEYRAASIGVHVRFFDKPRIDRIRTLVHELTHLIMSPLIQPLMDIAHGVMKKGDPLHDYHADHLRRLEETVTEDLSLILTTALNLPRAANAPAPAQPI